MTRLGYPHGECLNPPLYNECNVFIRYNYYKDGCYVATTIGVEVIECRAKTRLEALALLEAEIERRLPESHTDDEPKVIKSNELHIAW